MVSKRQDFYTKLLLKIFFQHLALHFKGAGLPGMKVANILINMRADYHAHSDILARISTRQNRPSISLSALCKLPENYDLDQSRPGDTEVGMCTYGYINLENLFIFHLFRKEYSKKNVCILLVFTPHPVN